LFLEGEARPEAGCPLNYKGLGTQNILVDVDTFRFPRHLDWEFAHTAAWQGNCYHMPFSLLSPDAKIERRSTLRTRTCCGRQLRGTWMCASFGEAGQKLRTERLALAWSFVETLKRTATKVYASFMRLLGIPGIWTRSL
jgi:hypothetical protein